MFDEMLEGLFLFQITQIAFCLRTSLWILRCTTIMSLHFIFWKIVIPHKVINLYPGRYVSTLIIICVWEPNVFCILLQVTYKIRVYNFISGLIEHALQVRWNVSTFLRKCNHLYQPWNDCLVQDRDLRS